MSRSSPSSPEGGLGCWALAEGLLVSKNRGPSGVRPGEQQAGLGSPDGCAGQKAPATDSSPGASLSHRPASPAPRLVTRLCWCCRLPRVPAPPVSDSGTGQLGSGGWGGILEGLGRAGDRLVFQRGMYVLGGRSLATLSPFGFPLNLLNFLRVPSPGHSFLAFLLVLIPGKGSSLPAAPVSAVWTPRGEAAFWKRTQKSTRCCRKIVRGGWPPGSPAPFGSYRRPWRPKKEVSPWGAWVQEGDSCRIPLDPDHKRY